MMMMDIIYFSANVRHCSITFSVIHVQLFLNRFCLLLL